MKRFALSLGCCLTLLALAAVALSEPAPATPVAGPAPATQAGSAEGAAAKSATPPTLTPEMAAVQAALAAERSRITELEARLAATKDDQAALVVMKEIEQVKRDTELGVLRLQAEFARREGREEQARKIDLAIAEFLTPPAPPAVMVERPAPVQAAQGR